MIVLITIIQNLMILFIYIYKDESTHMGLIYKQRVGIYDSTNITYVRVYRFFSFAIDYSEAKNAIMLSSP